MTAAEVKQEGFRAMMVREDGREDLLRVGGSECGIATCAEGCFPEGGISW